MSEFGAVLTFVILSKNVSGSQRGDDSLQLFQN